jgi:hypothetical protein
MWIGSECSGQFRLALTSPTPAPSSSPMAAADDTATATPRPVLDTPASPLHHTGVAPEKTCPRQLPRTSPPGCPGGVSARRSGSPSASSAPRPRIVARRQLLPREPLFSASPSPRTHAATVTRAPPVHSPVAAGVARRRNPRSPPNEHPPSFRRTSSAALAP